jgi:hypothetical protein
MQDRLKKMVERSKIEIRSPEITTTEFMASLMREVSAIQWGPHAIRSVICVGSLWCASPAMAGGGGAIDVARELVDTARSSSSLVKCVGWSIRPDGAGSVWASRGDWVIRARVMARVVSEGVERVELEGEMVASGSSYSVRAERIILSREGLDVRDAQVIWPDGEVMRVGRLTYAMDTGDARLMQVSVRGGVAATQEDKTEVIKSKVR